MEYLIREIKENEYPVLNDFLYEAIFVPDGAQPRKRRLPALPPSGVISLLPVSEPPGRNA